MLTPDELRRELALRVSDLGFSSRPVLFELAPDTIERARRYVMTHSLRKERPERLLRFIVDSDGLGLVYDPTLLGDAEQTLESGAGNCLSLASVLVGLARGIGWEARFVEMRARDPEPRIEGDIAIIEHHMVTQIRAAGRVIYVDYAGRLSYKARLRIISDLRATANYHINAAYDLIHRAKRQSQPAPWKEAALHYEAATRIAPELTSAWNNLGVALARQGELTKAAVAYRRAIELDGEGTEASRNLVLLQTAERYREGEELDGAGISLRPAGF